MSRELTRSDMAVNLKHAGKVYTDKFTRPHRTPGFTTLCCLCDASIAPTEHGICGPCAADLPRNQPACPGCAIPMPGNLFCPACQGSKKLLIDRVFALYRYDYPVNRLIQAMKYRSRPALACFLGHRLATAIDSAGPVRAGCLLPVPIHPLRLAFRGYNQSLEIARPVAARLGIPLLHSAICRQRHTQPQATLSPPRRRRNVAGAFRARDKTLPGYVVIVDDVVTSGATVTALARVLRNAGVRRIDVWALARAGM